MSETHVSCASCKDLVLQADDEETGYIQTRLQRIWQAIENGCQICQIIWNGLQPFAPKQDLNGLLAENPFFDITPAGGNYPVRVSGWVNSMGGEIKIELFTKADNLSPWPQFRPASLIAPRSDFPGCFQLIKKWMTECEQNHPNCKTESPILLPSRVIKIRRSGGAFEPILYDSKGETARFATLSYCWGSDQPLKTTKANLSLHRRGIKWSSIPKTIQDAIIITDRLGLEYLWVDSLTIIQDDPDDWASESEKMRDIYSTAHLTISATHADGCQTGCFSARSQEMVQVWPFETSSPEHHTSIVSDNVGSVLARAMPYRRISAYPLSTRAWALQEHLLSRRVIQYLSSELLWHCRESYAWESQPTLKSWDWSIYGGSSDGFRPMMVQPGNLNNQDYMKYHQMLWKEVVENYTQRHLTRLSDKLPAISGLAKEFQPVLGPYFAGLWESDLLAGLTWKTCTNSRKHTTLNYILPSHIAPSWSWASISGQVSSDAYREYVTPQNSRSTILGTDFRAKTSDRTSTVDAGTIIIRGRLVEGRLKYPSSISKRPKENDRGSTHYSGIVEIKDHIDVTVTTDYTRYSGEDGDAVKNVVVRETVEATAPRKFSNIRTWFRGDRKTITTERCNLQTPCRVYCLLLGSKEIAWKHQNDGTITRRTEEVALMLIPSRAVPGSFERVGISDSFFNNAFQGVREQNIKLV